MVSPRQPRVTAAQVLRARGRAGWYAHHQVGSHVQLRHGTLPGRITVPRHAGTILSPKTFASICAQAGLTVEELTELL